MLDVALSLIIIISVPNYLRATAASAAKRNQKFVSQPSALKVTIFFNFFNLRFKKLKKLQKL